MLPLHHDPGSPQSGVCVCAEPTYRSPPLHRREPSSDECHGIRAAGFEPAISSSPSLRISQAFPRPGRIGPAAGGGGSGRGLASCRPPPKEKARWSGHRALKLHEGVRDRPGVNGAGHGADAGSPNSRGAAWRIRRSGLVSDRRRSSQSRPLRTISGRSDPSRRRMIRGPDGRHRRVLHQMDAGPARDVRAPSGFFSRLAKVAGGTVAPTP
jgi:hypothetical protein